MKNATQLKALAKNLAKKRLKPSFHAGIKTLDPEIFMIFL